MPAEGIGQRVLYLVACAAPPAQQVDELVQAAQRRGWRVCVIATPSALAFLDDAGNANRLSDPQRLQAALGSRQVMVDRDGHG